MKQTVKCVFAALAALFVGGGILFAQVTTSSLNGLVVDEAGVPVVGVAILATHDPSGTVYTVITNEDGRYTINGMRSGGPYSVEFSCLGYQPMIYTDVTLQLAETYSLNVTMKEDSEMLSEAVVVASAASKFAAEKTGASTNISNSQMTALPTVSRSIDDVTRLSPYGGNGMSFAGADGRTANFTVDGANFNNNFGLNDGLPGGGSPISLDAIEEVQVVISPYDVRQTNFIGGGVNAITKSGTNTFKGTAYIYHRNENMRGSAVEGEDIAGARDRDRTTTYGFTLGGPIVKNKLFFFVNYEYSKIPTVANRWRASTDGEGDADAYISRTTVDDLTTISNFVKEKYGYDTGSFTDFPADESNQKILARLDWNIADNHHLAVRYNYTLNKAWNSPNASSSDCETRTVYARMSEYSMSFANSMYSMDNIVHSVSLDLNSRINDNLSNQLLATFSKLDDVRGTNSSVFPFIDILDGTGTITPYMSLGYELFTYNNGVHNTVANVKDDITYYVGTHKITAGASYEYQMADNSYMRNGTGYYRYDSMSNFMNGAVPETVCLTYGYDGEDAPAARVRFHKVGVYAQDEWNPNDKFMLSYGVRLDGLFFSNKDIMTNNAILALDYNGRHVDTGLWPSGKISVSPRVGFTWDIFGDKSLKFRGGTGLFSGRIPLVFFTNMPTNSGMVQNNVKIQVGDPLLENFAGGIITDKDEMKNFLNSLDPEKFPLTISPEDGVVGSSFAAVDRKFKMPQVWKTSVALDYAFPTSFPMSISGEFIFNKTVNGVCMTNWNVMPVDGFVRLNGPDNRPMYPENHTYTDTDAYVLTNTNKGYGYSANVMFNMSPVEGLDFTASYTHLVSKELTGMPGSDASSAFTYVPTVDGPNNPVLHNSQYVTPDRFFASLTYRDKCNNTFSLFYETWRGGYNYSYMYDGDFNGDGYNYDAIYIPNTKDELQFVSDDDRDRFWAYLENDKYLSRHKGEYAEAYSVYSPWVHRLDFHYSHDFKVRIGKTSNTLQLSVDIKNLLNIFNSSWGVSKQMNPNLSSGRILTCDHINADGVPVFSTNDAVSATTPTWTYYHDIGQCWYAQVGIKYMFN
ncbi:MAG: TonB-dependent receptor [Bacteroidetes bacterium]|uniref:TonB-dependent receptor n=1 Tax=Candidatus Cryptobacteroides faecipullorum TaxID=2840764 RepID=A0A9D9NBG4_9BACT|nr:TonB-dependent receptor [Candidatus Cryptobacteroides faecipullorum]